ncbi:hypothetical protein FVE85_6230 [Porphyridium purpureum]|uniref:Uncharacterized protein n=1 Tax=Porphyridium purpureum TaxID=35688 RepID=A0A5J4Z5N9_PORPP|nr:hypothetical protein FVE85_6230 [Porphyridium purpureum]|eukprot:POR0030..scf295_1
MERLPRASAGATAMDDTMVAMESRAWTPFMVTPGAGYDVLASFTQDELAVARQLSPSPLVAQQAGGGREQIGQPAPAPLARQNVSAPGTVTQHGSASTVQNMLTGSRRDVSAYAGQVLLSEQLQMRQSQEKHQQQSLLLVAAPAPAPAPAPVPPEQQQQQQQQLTRSGPFAPKPVRIALCSQLGEAADPRPLFQYQRWDPETKGRPTSRDASSPVEQAWLRSRSHSSSHNNAGIINGIGGSGTGQPESFRAWTPFLFHIDGGAGMQRTPILEEPSLSRSWTAFESAVHVPLESLGNTMGQPNSALLPRSLSPPGAVPLERINANVNAMPPSTLGSAFRDGQGTETVGAFGFAESEPFKSSSGKTIPPPAACAGVPTLATNVLPAALQACLTSQPQVSTCAGDVRADQKCGHEQEQPSKKPRLGSRVPGIAATYETSAAELQRLELASHVPAAGVVCEKDGWCLMSMYAWVKKEQDEQPKISPIISTMKPVSSLDFSSPGASSDHVRAMAIRPPSDLCKEPTTANLESATHPLPSEDRASKSSMYANAHLLSTELPDGKSVPSPSAFCHVCMRRVARVEQMICGNILTRKCRKVVCKLCFPLLGQIWPGDTPSDAQNAEPTAAGRTATASEPEGAGDTRGDSDSPAHEDEGRAPSARSGRHAQRSARPQAAPSAARALSSSEITNGAPSAPGSAQAEPLWVCCHCTSTCPERATCTQYRRGNEKLKQRRANADPQPHRLSYSPRDNARDP